MATRDRTHGSKVVVVAPHLGTVITVKTKVQTNGNTQKITQTSERETFAAGE